MASPSTPPVPGGYDSDSEPPSRSRIALVATLLAVAVLLGGWIYVLFVYDPGLMIDELADPTFPNAAEEVCAAAQAELAQLPPASSATSADERADVVARSNAILADMLAGLAPLVPTAPEPGTVDDAELDRQRQVSDGVAEWLGDWQTYLGNRRDYVENLRVDDDARFLESTKGSDTKGISRAINSFAQVNRMESCTTPADLS